MQLTKRFYWSDVLLLSLLLGLVYFSFLGSRPLYVPDEGRYAEIAREMVNNQDYITPYLNGIKYFEKPVLFYWLEAGMIKLFGLKLFWLRSINALFAFFCTLFTYFVIGQIYNRAIALMSSLILGTSILFVIMSQMLSLDLTVTVMLTTCLYLFILGANNDKRRASCFYASALFAGFAVLAKGLIGIIFPLVIISSWLAITKQWRLLRWQTVLLCLGIFLSVTVPWHALVGYRNPEFFFFYFIEQHFLRYLDKAVGHYQPVWYFIPVLVLGLFPWFFFLPASIKHVFRQKIPANALYFLIWGVFIFIFFSFSKSKLIPYILPVFPPFAVLIAYYLASNTLQDKSLKISVFCLFLFTFFLVFILFKYPISDQFPNKAHIQLRLIISALVLAIGILCSSYFALTHLNKMRITLVATSLLFLPFMLSMMPYLDTRTIYPLAKQLQTVLKPEDEVIAINHYYQDLPFYLKRKVSVLNWKNELSYGMQFQDTKNWMLDDQAFWQKWHSAQRVYGFVTEEKLASLLQRYPKEQYTVYARQFNTLIISNQRNP